VATHSVEVASRSRLLAHVKPMEKAATVAPSPVIADLRSVFLDWIQLIQKQSNENGRVLVVPNWDWTCNAALSSTC